GLENAAKEFIVACQADNVLRGLDGTPRMLVHGAFQAKIGPGDRAAEGRVFRSGFATTDCHLLQTSARSLFEVVPQYIIVTGDAQRSFRELHHEPKPARCSCHVPFLALHAARIDRVILAVSRSRHGYSPRALALLKQQFKCPPRSAGLPLIPKIDAGTPRR